MRGRIEPAVGLVLGLAGEIKLGHQPIELALDRKVNVRRPHIAVSGRIAARFDGPKTVVPGRIRRETREAFEIGIQRRRVGVARVTIFSFRIGLPDVDAGMRNGLSQTVEHASPDMEELALRFAAAVAWARQVGCKIGPFADRIERSEDLRRRDRECPCGKMTDPSLGAMLIHWGSLISASLMIFSQREISARIS